MDVLRTQGKIIYAGSSNFAGWHIAQAQETARHRAALGLVSEQSLYNLATRAVELEVLPACRAYGVGLICWSPLHGGLLGGVLRKTDGVRGSAGRSAQALAGKQAQVAVFEALCDELGEEPADVAVAWLLHQPGVTSVIAGPRVVRHLDGTLRAATLRLDETTLERLDTIFPGPGGPAPEAYAW
jgi:aryl-alcohol dehydrogenase-like predicted oxidoreductase